jgi:glycosyltransferase involved in cell wall biosynthesis
MKTHVLMCCHNGAEFVSEQLESIALQRMKIDIVHLHDFGSSDATVARAEAVAIRAGLSLQVTCHASAPGAALSFFAAMRNLAEKVGSGDVIFLCDQDDVWLPDKTFRVMESLRSHLSAECNPEVACFHDVKVTDRRLDIARETYYTGDPFAVPRDLEPRRLVLSSPVIGHTMAVTGALLHRVVRMATPDCYLMHDWATVLFASRFGVITFVPEALSLYRQHGKNVLGAYGRRGIFARLARVYRFADAVVQQALGFLKDTETEQPKVPECAAFDSLIRRAATRSVPLAYLRLSITAARTGPTNERKLLGFFIAFHGLRRVIA